MRARAKSAQRPAHPPRKSTIAATSAEFFSASLGEAFRNERSAHYSRFAEIPPQQLLQSERCADCDGFPGNLHEPFRAQIREGPRQRFTHRPEFSRENPFRPVEREGDRFGLERWWTTFEKPVGQTRLNAFQRQVVEQSHQDPKMLTHRTKHAQREL